MHLFEKKKRTRIIGENLYAYEMQVQSQSRHTINEKSKSSQRTRTHLQHDLSIA